MRSLVILMIVMICSTQCWGNPFKNLGSKMQNAVKSWTPKLVVKHEDVPVDVGIKQIKTDESNEIACSKYEWCAKEFKCG